MLQKAFDDYANRKNLLDLAKERTKAAKEVLERSSAWVILRDAKHAQSLHQQEHDAARLTLESQAQQAFEDGQFNGRSRLEIDGGWVQFDKPKMTLEVVDAAAFLAFVVDRGVADTLVESVKLNQEAADGLAVLFPKIPGTARDGTQRFRVSVVKGD